MLGALAWPLAIALAWIAGEFGNRWTGLPRVSWSGLVGFVLGNTHLGILPLSSAGSVMLVADVAFGLILFEFGHRRWAIW